MDASLVYSGSIAASGSAGPFTVTVPAGKEALEVQTLASYAAMAATTGIQATFNKSADGVTYSADQPASDVNAPSQTAVFQGTSEVISLTPSDSTVAGPVAFVRVTLTNLDATNAASVVILAQAFSGA